MRVVIRADPQLASEFVAKYIRDRILSFKPSLGRPFVLGLPTGSTPIPVYKKLVEFHKAGQLSFKHVVTFNMDEYVGLARDHPESYHSFMWKHLFSHIDIIPSNVHILDGNVKDLVAECVSYEEKIKSFGGIELFLAGLGNDGHIAFNEPGSSLTSRTRVKTLAYDTILANSRFFGNDMSKVPTMALTVGVGTVMDAREVIVVATGAHKADALMKCIEQGVNHMYTMSALQLHPCAMVVCDEAATLDLRVRTVRYFTGIEKTCAGVTSLSASSSSSASLTTSSSTHPTNSDKINETKTDTALGANLDSSSHPSFLVAHAGASSPTIDQTTTTVPPSVSGSPSVSSRPFILPGFLSRQSSGPQPPPT